MKTIDPVQLLNKYKTGECTPEELAIVEAYIFYEGTVTKDLIAIESEIEENINEISLTTSKSRINKWPLNILFAAAAIVVIAGIYTVLFTNNTSLPANYANDIDPGGNKAVLTFQNGKTIQLNEAKKGVIIDASKLSYSDGTKINSEVTQVFTLSTPKGGTYQMDLPDGSKVWLNAATSLTYTPPIKEKGSYRSVKLIGEAYFEISKDTKHPFVVTTDLQKIEVLGTHFNVSAYNDDELSINKTTLLEGSVKIAPLTVSGNKMKEVVLKPNQESTIGPKGIQVADVHADESVAWKNGEFSFNREPLKSIMEKIARWYDVEVTFVDHKLERIPFNGTISRFEKVSQVLCLLEATGDVRFKIDGRRITVME